MQSFKKIISSLLLFIISFVIITLGIVEPYFHTNAYYDVDYKVRDELSGSIDFLISGASHAMCDFHSPTVDKELGCSSYNLGQNGMSFTGRFEILKKEIERNPVKTVVIDISYDALTRDIEKEGPSADMFQIARYASISEKFSFVRKTIKPDDYLEVFSDLLFLGLKSWSKILVLGKDPYSQKDLKGYQPQPCKKIDIKINNLANEINTKTISTDIVKKNYDILEKTVVLCQSHNIDVVFVVTPLSDKFLYPISNLDEVYKPYYKLANKYDIPLYDFNLVKNKNDIFPEEYSFSNETHLSERGSIKFSSLFSHILKSKISSDNSKYFYSNYSDMKLNSPYMEYLNK